MGRYLQTLTFFLRDNKCAPQVERAVKRSFCNRKAAHNCVVESFQQLRPYLISFPAKLAFSFHLNSSGLHRANCITPQVGKLFIRLSYFLPRM
jgi:hypothetical protein